MENLIKPEKVQNIINKFCYTIGMIPTSYKMSLTYEEQIIAIGHYLETTVYPAINNNAEALAELQNLFLDLKNYVDNYFDNLDVQKEINNKLDEMAQSGELAEIIAQYIEFQGLLCYDSVNDMKNASNLVNGSFVKTYGFYTKNDGGGAFYKIRNIINTDIIDNKLIIALNNHELVAELMTSKTLNVLQLGITNDGLQNSDLYVLNDYLNNFNIFIPEGKYLLSNNLIISRDNTSFVCNGSILLQNNGFLINACNCLIDINKITGDITKSIALKLFTDNNNLHSIWNNIINIREILNCKTGLFFNPSHKGCQYNKINFNEINCENDIYFLAFDGGWVNENIFNGGRLSGTNGIIMEKGQNIGDFYNGNKFNSIGFENITNPINLHYAMRNSFSHSRMSESLNGDYWIQCDNETRLNVFQNDSSLHFDKVNDLNSALTSRNIYKANPIIFEGHYYGYEAFVINTKKCLNQRPVENTTPTTMAYGITGEYETPIYYNEMLINIGCDSNKSSEVTLPNIFDNAGITNFIVRVSYRGTSANLVLKDSQGNVILSNDDIGSGNYIQNKYFKVSLNYGDLKPKWLVQNL